MGSCRLVYQSGLGRNGCLGFVFAEKTEGLDGLPQPLYSLEGMVGCLRLFESTAKLPAVRLVQLSQQRSEAGMQLPETL